MKSEGLKKTLDHLRQTLAPPEESARTDGQLLASFIATRDGSAFAALVRRHGRMVLGVCRRVLGHVQDAEDAFQATFLVLACKASSLRNGEAVGNWLYGVAYRIALEAKTRRARQRSREQPLDNVPHPEVSPEEPRDWLPLLEKALNGLPERYRTPVILCHLEGHSRREAARQLGLPEGTLSSRLATGRQLLAKRLSRHRLMLSMGVVLAALSDETASAAVPASFLVSTIQDALRIAAGQAVTTPAAVLMKEVLHMMLLTKLKLATLFVATVGVMGVMAASFFAPMRAAEDRPAEPKPVPEAAAKRTLAKKITQLENDFGDVSSLLGIDKRIYEIEIRPLKPHTLLGVDLEVYKDGRKQKTNVGGSVAVEKPIRAKLALLAADLDYLPLAGARKNHYRIQVGLALYGNVGTSFSSSTIDVSKELFDFHQVCSTGFTDTGSEIESPLFYLVSRSNDGVTGNNTISQIIEKYSKGGLIVVYLRVRKK